jgi:hypothetical protein
MTREDCLQFAQRWIERGNTVPGYHLRRGRDGRIVQGSSNHLVVPMAPE